MVINVSPHAIEKYNERVGEDASRSDLERMFKNHNYSIIGVGRQGRMIVALKDYVFVISRSRSKLGVVTCLGYEQVYTARKPICTDLADTIRLNKWKSSTAYRSKRKAKILH